MTTGEDPSVRERIEGIVYVDMSGVSMLPGFMDRFNKALDGLIVLLKGAYGRRILGGGSTLEQ